MIFDYTKKLEFQSVKSLEQIIQSLHSKTYKSYWQVFLSGNIPDSFMVGRVESDKVKLCRMRAKSWNSLTPYFYGKFNVLDDKVHLLGKFTIHPFVKVFLIIFLLLLFFFLIVSLLIIMDSTTRFVGMLMFGVNIGLLYLLYAWKKMSSRDVKWISSEIENVLN